MAKGVDATILRHTRIGRASSIDSDRMVDETRRSYLVTDQLIRRLLHTVLYLQMVALGLGNTMLLSQLAPLLVAQFERFLRLL